MQKVYKIGHEYKDILSVSRENDQFVSWFAYNGSGIGNSGGIRSGKYLKLNMDVPSYIVLITRGISHRSYNPWEDIIDYSTSSIFYWGDAKLSKNKHYSEFKGNKNLLKVFEHVLENNLTIVPPILHFSKTVSGIVKFNGLCVIASIEHTWFEDKGNPVKNYRYKLSILDVDEVKVEWLHNRVQCTDFEKLNKVAPKVWVDYIKGNTRKLDIWSKSIIKKVDQLPPEKSEATNLLVQLSELSPTQFEAVVVDLFRNLPVVNHKIVRTRPTADGGFDFYGQFSIPYPVNYQIGFIGEVKKFARNSAVQPKHISRLVARLSRGQYGIFVTTSYYTEQAQREVLEDGYPVKLFSGIDLIKFLHELRLVDQGKIKKDWLESVTKNI